MSSTMFQYCRNESSCTNNNVVQTNEFGNFQETYGWVECESKSFPGKTYFYNIRTRYSTWIKPVLLSQVRLPRFTKKLENYDTDFKSDLDDSLMMVSESDRKDDPNGKRKTAKKKQNNKKTWEHSKISTHLRHGNSICVNIFNNGNGYSKDNFDCISKRSLSSHSNKVMDDFFMENKPDQKNVYENFDLRDTKPDFLENWLHDFKNILFTAEKNEETTSKKDVPILSKVRLETTPDCLLRKEVQKKRMKPNVKKQTPLEKTNMEARKIICEMYGTKVVNYDPVEKQLPPWVKISKLSDTSTCSSFQRIKDVKPSFSINCKIPNVNSGLELSSHSSSSTSSSCSCSCSSTLSSTSSNKSVKEDNKSIGFTS